MKQTAYDVVIVGQGLAGSLLAWSLIRQGMRICIYSDNKQSASSVAAGLINPVTGQRFVLARLTPQMLTWAKKFYQHLEAQLNISCFHPLPMTRLFNSEKEQLNYQKRTTQDHYRPFFTDTPLPDNLNQGYAGITQQHTAWLDTNTLLGALHQYFKQHAQVRHDAFHPNTVTTTKVIYCEGYQMGSNPMFSWLPMQMAHGEIITCKTSSPLPVNIINKSKWLLPLSSHQCRIGATYDTTFTTPTIQKASKQHLLQFAHGLFKGEQTFDCIEHQAGIRAATRDKQPFIGFHPNNPNIGIFNGFGSRGSLLIPWYSHALTKTLTQQQPLPSEADIKRYQA